MLQSSKYLNRNTALLLVLLATVLVTAQQLNLGIKAFGISPKIYFHYNNYVIFKNSFFHLIDNLNLYQRFKAEQFDLYKYSPSFALFMGLFAYLPDWLGLFLWNALNSLVLFFALWNCMAIASKHKFWVIVVILAELIISMQNSQSNGLLAGLIIMAYNFLEGDRAFWAVGVLMFTVFIKLFGLVAFVLLLLYPSRWRSIVYGMFWLIFLFLLPLVVISFLDLLVQYQNWWVMLQKDHSKSLGTSVAGFMGSFVSFKSLKIWVLAIGALLFSIPLLNFKRYEESKFRILYLASILLWVVIFNHKAESPTFIIAMAGIAIWYFAIAKPPTKWDTFFLLIAIVLTSLSSTDLFPFAIRKNFIVPYSIKALPSIIVWLWVTYKLASMPMYGKEEVRKLVP